MKFAVGDRVESTIPLGLHGINRQIQLGTVFKANDVLVYVRFDNKRIHDMSGYIEDREWYHETWRTVDDTKSFIPEDWS